MTTASCNIISTLRNLFPDGPEITAGNLENSTELLSSPEAVIKAFQDFSGEGWLCLTTDREILRFSSSRDLEAISGWPLAGEAVKGKTSLHLIRRQKAWELAWIRSVESSDESFLVRSFFLSRDQGRLWYETAWSLQESANQKEIRPKAFRFLGFSEPGKEA